MPPTLLVAASSLTMPWSLPIPSLPSPPTSLQVPCLKFYCSFLIDIIFFISLTFLSHPKQSQVHSWIIDAVGREAVVYFHLIWCSGILLHEVTQFVEDRNAEFKDCQDDIRDALFSTTSGLSTVRRAFLALRHLFVTSKDVAAGAVSDIIEVADLAAPSLAFIALLDASLEVRARPPTLPPRHHHHYSFTEPHRAHFARVSCCVRLRPRCTAGLLGVSRHVPAPVAPPVQEGQVRSEVERDPRRQRLQRNVHGRVAPLLRRTVRMPPQWRARAHTHGTCARQAQTTRSHETREPRQIQAATVSCTRARAIDIHATLPVTARHCAASFGC